MRRSLLGLLVLCAACADLSRDDQDGLSTGASQGDGDTGDADEDDSGGIKLDVDDGMGTAGDEGGGDMGCKGIDFLFVVDNSGSMKDEQENLVASFPGFVDAMEEKVAELEAGDFHIMVTDSDSTKINDPGPYCGLSCEDPTDVCYADNGSDVVSCAFSMDYGCLGSCRDSLDNSCDFGSCKDLLGCDECGCNLGSGRLDAPDGNPCDVAGGERFIQDGQPNLDSTFACLAEVGTQGDGDERIAGATVRALAPEVIDGGCNDGFIREDAILVVTLITDEEDAFQGEGSAGDPPDWYDAVVASKSGDEEAIVMLGLVGDGGQPNAVCVDEGNGNGGYPPRLIEFIESFPRHVVGSVCEPNYAGFFEQAVDLIKDTCEVYVPPQG